MNKHGCSNIEPASPSAREGCEIVIFYFEIQHSQHNIVIENLRLERSILKKKKLFSNSSEWADSVL